MAMGLSPATSAVVLTAKSFFVKRGRLERISKAPLLPLRGSNVSGILVGMYVSNDSVQINKYFFYYFFIKLLQLSLNIDQFTIKLRFDWEYFDT
jgi:hypothetical protein